MMPAARTEPMIDDAPSSAAGFVRGRDLLWFPPEGGGAELPRPWPLLLFLHGKGERGGAGELDRVARWGPPRLRAGGWRLADGGFPFLLAAPQCPEDATWCDEEMLVRLVAFLDGLVAAQIADPARLYLSGFSMGGIGAWCLALRQPERFAAVVSVCGRCLTPKDLSRLAGRPAWVAYAEDDEIEELAIGSRELVARLAPFGRLHSRPYRLGQQGNLNAHVGTCERAFADPVLYHWLAQQRL
jgi:predicted peptidase